MLAGSSHNTKQLIKHMMKPAKSDCRVPRKSSTSIPPTVLPSFDKKRKAKGTFCQRLARNLERYDENPGVFDESKRHPLPPILRLPAELRQHILFSCLDDEDILYPRPNSITQPLAMVCRTFADDVREVMKLWRAHELAVRKSHGAGQDFSSLVADLLGPIQAASAVLTTRAKLRPPKDRRRRDRNATRISSAATTSKHISPGPGDVKAMVSSPSKDGRNEAREARKLQRQKRKQARQAEKFREKRSQRKLKKKQSQLQAKTNAENLYDEWAESHPDRAALVGMRKAYEASVGCSSGVIRNRK